MHDERGAEGVSAHRAALSVDGAGCERVRRPIVEPQEGGDMVCLAVKRRAPSLKGRLLHARVYYGQPLARVEREINQQAVGEREVVAALDGWKVGRVLGRARVAAVTE